MKKQGQGVGRRRKRMKMEDTRKRELECVQGSENSVFQRGGGTACRKVHRGNSDDSLKS